MCWQRWRILEDPWPVRGLIVHITSSLMPRTIALVLLILETVNDYVRFHGESARVVLDRKDS